MSVSNAVFQPSAAFLFWKKKLIIMPICYIQPVLDENVRQLCCRPYYNHPNGCPNYGKRDICPPRAPILQQVFNIDKPILAIWCSFNLALHRDKMRAKHPTWSQKQLECCLYWQGRVNKQLRKAVEYNLIRYPLFNNATNLISTFVPEAMGVNVTKTMKNAGVILEWPPQKTVIKIAFVGVSIKDQKHSQKALFE